MAGLVLKDDKARYYFLRPELLEAAKVPENETIDLEKAIDPKLISSISIVRPKIPDIAASTVMCPW